MVQCYLLSILVPMAVAGWSLISNFQHLEETRLDLDKPDLDDSRRKKRQEKNLRRKQRRLAKKDSMMRTVRQGTPIPDLAPPSSGSEPFKIAATVLTDKNSSIIVDLSNYKPFTAASSGDEPFLVRVSNFLQSGFCKRVFFIFLYWDHLYPTSKLQASFVMWVSVSWISMLNLLGRNLGCSGAC